MKTLNYILQNYLAEYLERLLLVLFGVGLGVKILVVNHNIDPATLNLDMMVADYVLVIFAPLAATSLNMLINRVMPEDNEISQEMIDAVLDFTEPDGYTNMEDITDDNGIVKSSDLQKAKFPPEAS